MRRAILENVDDYDGSVPGKAGKGKKDGKAFSRRLVLGADTAGRNELLGIFLRDGKKEVRQEFN